MMERRGLDLSSNQESTQSDEQCCGGRLARLDFTEAKDVDMSRRRMRISLPGRVEGVKEEELQRPQTPTSLPPAVDPLPKSIDALVAKELYKLSLQGRNRVLEEIHGVQNADGSTEMDDLRGKSLVALYAQLQSAPAESAFTKARDIDPDYISREKFYLKFLRAEQFNANNAAIRLLAFFEYKLELFGLEKLTQDIEIRDLWDNPRDRQTLQSGLFQPLSSRDRSMRLVVGKFHKHDFSDLPLESRLRVFYYMMMTTTEHEIDQKRGVVLLVMNQDGVVDRMDAWRNTTLLGALPVRVNGIHICHNDPKITALSSLGMLAMGSDYRARCRLHQGSAIENIYTLLTFGISSKILPLHPSTGNVAVDFLNRWIKKRKFVERGTRVDTLQKDRLISLPADADVIFGRGKGIQDYPGNIRLRELIDVHLEKYQSAKLLEKTLIAELVIQEIKDDSGRFLKQADEGWIEVKDDTAREKISHAFRDRRRKKMKQHEQEQSNSLTLQK